MLFPLVAALLVLDGAVLWWIAAVTRRRRTIPAADAFALAAAVNGLLAFSLAVGIGLDGLPMALVGIATIVGYCFPLPWLFFSLRYTGQRGSFSSALAAFVASPLVVGVLLTGGAFVLQLLPELSFPASEPDTGPTAVVFYLFSIAQSLVLLYAAGVVLVGCGVLLWSFYRYEFLDLRVGLLLAAFAITPWLSVLLGYWVVVAGALAFTTVVATGISLGTVAALAAAGPFDLFEQAPAAGTLGPRTLFEELDEAVIVTDTDGMVVKLNAAAENHHPAEPGEALGRSIESLLGNSLDELRGAEAVALYTERGRSLFEPNVSTLSDQRGAPLGYAVVLRDVTERTTREQRLSVFNRVLRHDLRNDMNVILGHAEQVLRADDERVAADSAETILDTGRDLLESSEEVQHSEQLLDTAEPAGDTALLSELAEQAMEAATAGQDVDWLVEVSPDIVVEGAPLVEHILDNLLENAICHNDSDEIWLRVGADYDPDRFQSLRLVVEDNGPGIPDHEKQAIEAEGESPLRHGSGIGLWTVRWAVTQLGGDLTLTDREPRGAAVTVWLSRASREEPSTRP